MSLDPLPASTPDRANDAWLWRVLQKEKNREMIALLENTLQSFISDTQQTALTFPPRSAFHRRVCSLVALRYGLDARLEPSGVSVDACAVPAAGENVCLVLFKTPRSATPPGRLAQFAKGPPPPSCPPQATPTGLPSAPTARPLQTPLDPPAAPRPAMFLRRPRTADGKVVCLPVPASSSAASMPSATTALKRMSEEDYQRTRARIFKATNNNNNNSNNDNNAVASNTSSNSGSAGEDYHSENSAEWGGGEGSALVKGGGVAKGPVEGSTGFERRRNRRAGPAVQATAEKSGRTAVVCEDRDASRVNGEAASRAGRTSAQQRLSRDSRSNSASASGAHTTSANARRLSYAPENGDLQDPDFDRSYIKWARRESVPPPPATQAMPLPVFSQLLYPYSAQSLPHMHVGNMHMHSVSTGGVVAGQYQGAMTHAPSGAVMFPHVGQGVGTIGGDFVGTSAGLGVGVLPSGVGTGMTSGMMTSGMAVGVERSTPYEMRAREHAVSLGMAVGMQHSHALAQLQPPPIPTQVARRPSPAYGLDSTVDFPPLP